ncbi:hypothetical protein [Saccharopolyspora sp. 6V]|uniref:hypothetical protein n=1 Tax=Saccharopolyspora sp. 6V TaxID=2877239 RepID=UPI001CD2F333|nr:hypothetical protein [Saccharopolyspora sp. 6V]MCA1194491.1 hypothetical protein [Saccharopolyspora sp. 6V]
MTDMFCWQPPEPRELPTLRERMAAQMRSPLEQRMLVDLLTTGQGTLSPNTGDRGRDAAIMLREEHDRLRGAQLFYVSAEMTRLAQAAARSLTAASTHPDDLPAAAGFMVFAEPFAVYEPDRIPSGEQTEQCVIVAVSWGPNGALRADQGMWLTFWSATDYDAETRYVQRQLGCSEEEATQMVRRARAPLTWDNEAVCHYGATTLGLLSNATPGRAGWTEELEAGPSWEQMSGTTAAWTLIVRSAWLLMTQDGITDTTDEPMPRQQRRRAEREGYNAAPVRVVHLRHRENSPTAAEPGERAYHVRWVVRGHWRNQWYPSRGEHRPVWINPHIKGPAGSPLHETTTVHMLD